MAEPEDKATGGLIERPLTVTLNEHGCDRTAPAVRAGVELVGGSPCVHINGEPVAWLANWVRA